MHGTRNELKPVVSGSCLFAYWLFHTITSERKGLSKIHELKIKKSLLRTYLDSSVETNDVAEKVITDTQTDTQDKYSNPPAHARRGLNMQYASKK